LLDEMQRTMTLATHNARGMPKSAATPQLGANALSLMLVNGAMQCIDLARDCIERGEDPRRHLRSAALRVRELPATLSMPANHPLAVSFSDLCEYINRQLSAIGDERGLPALEGSCDLLREICRAWMTMPTGRVKLSADTHAMAEL
jgi:flagellin-specific chaperone FliS